MNYQINLEYFKFSTEKTYLRVFQENPPGLKAVYCTAHFFYDLIAMPLEFLSNRVVDMAALGCRVMQIFLSKPSDLPLSIDQRLKKMERILEGFEKRENSFSSTLETNSVKIEQKIQGLEEKMMNVLFRLDLECLVQEISHRKIPQSVSDNIELAKELHEGCKRNIDQFPQEKRADFARIVCKKIAPIAASTLRTPQAFLCEELIKLLLSDYPERLTLQGSKTKSNLLFPLMKNNKPKNKDCAVEDLLSNYRSDRGDLYAIVQSLEQKILHIDRYNAYNELLQDLQESIDEDIKLYTTHFLPRIQKILSKFPNKIEMKSRLCKELVPYAEKSQLCRKVIGRLLLETQYPEGIYARQDVRDLMRQGTALSLIQEQIEEDLCESYLASFSV